MTHEKPYLLGLNVGSSSITFALYHRGEPPKRQLHGKVDRIGMRGTVIATDTRRVDVRVIHTDEEAMIVKAVGRLVHHLHPERRT